MQSLGPMLKGMKRFTWRIAKALSKPTSIHLCILQGRQATEDIHARKWHIRATLMSNSVKMPHSVLDIRCTVFHQICCLQGRSWLSCSIDLDIDARRSRFTICALQVLCSGRLPAFLQRQFRRFGHSWCSGKERLATSLGRLLPPA